MTVRAYRLAAQAAHEALSGINADWDDLRANTVEALQDTATRAANT